MPKPNPNPEPEPTPISQEERRRRFARRPATKGDVIRITLAIRQIQQQLSITPLLRLKLEVQPGDDDNGA